MQFCLPIEETRLENHCLRGPDLRLNLCAYIFVFNDVQEMQECCQCDLSADSPAPPE